MDVDELPLLKGKLEDTTGSANVAPGEGKGFSFAPTQGGYQPLEPRLYAREMARPFTRGSKQARIVEG